MKKIVINSCYGGFSLSEAAVERFKELSGDTEATSYHLTNNSRNNPHLVQVVEELGSKADGRFANLKIVEIPDDVEWIIEEYDGIEWVSEVHRTWE